MGKVSRFLGIDVHAESIAVAVAEPSGEVRSLGTIPNRPEAIRKLVRRLGAPESLRACYEAGPCGYVLYWQLSELGIACEVVAPTLVPTRPGDRVKTDRRDAEKLARCFRSGDLTPVWVPDAAHEALRDLMRAREAAKRDQLRARNRLQKLLLKHGRRQPQVVTAWTLKHLTWIRTQAFEHAAQQATFLDYLMEVEHAADRVVRLERAIDGVLPSLPAEMKAVIDGLQALRGVARLTAATIVAEVGPLTRFTHPRQLMGYAGIVPSEHSSGRSTHRCAITKTGNAHLRRVMVEAAWPYRHRPAVIGALQRRQRDLDEEVKAVAWKAQLRLCSRYHRLAAKGKPHGKVVAAVARELLGFIWAIGVSVERRHQQAIVA
jgi:transposase